MAEFAAFPRRQLPAVSGRWRPRFLWCRSRESGALCAWTLSPLERFSGFLLCIHLTPMAWSNIACRRRDDTVKLGATEGPYGLEPNGPFIVRVRPCRGDGVGPRDKIHVLEGGADCMTTVKPWSRCHLFEKWRRVQNTQLFACDTARRRQRHTRRTSGPTSAAFSRECMRPHGCGGPTAADQARPSDE